MCEAKHTTIRSSNTAKKDTGHNYPIHNEWQTQSTKGLRSEYGPFLESENWKFTRKIEEKKSQDPR